MVAEAAALPTAPLRSRTGFGPPRGVAAPRTPPGPLRRRAPQECGPGETRATVPSRPLAGTRAAPGPRSADWAPSSQELPGRAGSPGHHPADPRSLPVLPTAQLEATGWGDRSARPSTRPGRPLGPRAPRSWRDCPLRLLAPRSSRAALSHSSCPTKRPALPLIGFLNSEVSE